MLSPLEEDSESTCSEVMEVSEEQREEERRRERALELGFAPQKEVVYNRLLPYSSDIDAEATRWFQDIKANLGRAIALRELRPGLVVWVSRLNKFLRLYGLRFPKADHVALIQLLLPLLAIPDLEPFVVNHLASCLVSLLKRRELLTSEELQVEWRPLYHLYEATVNSKRAVLGLVKIPSSLEPTLRQLVRCCRPYFPLAATAEMLVEWRPLMCPLDVTMGKAMTYYEMFLPTFLVAAAHPEASHRLWLEEFSEFWTACGNSANWEPCLLALLARLAEDAPGAVDWAPLLPVVFARVQKMFGLPVHYNKTNVGYKGQHLDSLTAARWVVSTLGGPHSSQAFLTQLLASLESYYHPANSGKYVIKLTEFLSKLVSCFIKRVHRERHRRPAWGPTTPAAALLSDTDITAFVEAARPVVFQAMWLRCLDVGAVVQALATLRPALILPTLVSRLWAALDTVTEPHKLTACMLAVVGVARCLVQHTPDYPEGQTHVLPLLYATLPGIDTNDLRKSMVTFQFISTFATFIPFVDNSREAAALEDLTEEEAKIYQQSAQLEDFVVEFLNRCFAIVESSEVQQIRSEVSTDDATVSREDNMKDVGMASTFSAILIQCSCGLYDVALRKVAGWLAGRILEWRVSGRIAAGLARCLTKVRPARGLAGLLPPLLTSLEAGLAEREEQAPLTDEIKFQVMVVAELARVPGDALLPYLGRVEGVLASLTTHSSREGDHLTGNLLKNVLRSLTHVFPTDYRSVAAGFDRSPESWRPLGDWGAAGDCWDLQPAWHLPSEEELAAAQRLITAFLAAPLARLARVAAGEEVVAREQVTSLLALVSQAVQGAGGLLPPWPAPTIHLKPSRVELAHQAHVAFQGASPELTVGGANARLRVVQVLHSLLAHLLAASPDDTKALVALASTYHKVLFFSGVQRDEYDSRWKGFQAVKRCMENKLLGSRRHIRRVLVDRAHLQHESRLVENGGKDFTEEHREVYSDLLLLATSHYAEVRIKGQEVLGKAMKVFSYSYQEVVPRLVDLLRQGRDKVSHEQFKGVLYLVLGPKGKSLLIKHNWSTFCSLLPAVVEASHSEKPSIIKVFQAVQETVVHHLETLTIALAMPDTVVPPALALWTPGEQEGGLATALEPSSPAPTPAEVEEGVRRMEEGNAATLALFSGLLDQLCEQLESGRLHWRQYSAGFALLAALTRYDVPLGARAVRLMVANLVHDNLAVRKVAIHNMAGVLRQHKRRHPKVERRVVRAEGKVVAGDREDNAWLQYREEHWPTDQEAWNRPNFVHKTHFGYYAWPEVLEVYAGEEEQPRLDRAAGELGVEEREVFTLFTDPKFLTRLVDLLSLEETKGKDRFDSRKFLMWKGLFRNFGACVLEGLKARLESLCEEEAESSQRAAAELVAGLVRGAKHWPWAMTERLWGWLVPLLRRLLGKVTVETIGDWGTCFATASESRDPNRLHWLLEVLMEEPLRSQGSFLDSSRLYVLQGAVAQQEWRIGSLLHRLDSFLRPFLTHPYQNVRERLGSVVANIYALDIPFPGAQPASPTLAPLVAEVLPRLALMLEEPDQELYDFHRSAARGPQDLVEGDLVRVAARLPKDLGERVVAQGLPALQQLLARPPGGPPAIPAEVLARLPPEVRRLPPAELAAAVEKALGRQVPAGLPLLRAAVTEVLTTSEGAQASERWEERQAGVRLLQTVCKLLAGVLLRNWYSAKPELYAFLEMLAINESSELEPDLARDCNVALACLASHLVPLAVLPAALASLARVSTSTSWRARTAGLEFLQVLVFNNLAAFHSMPEEAARVTDIVARLLKDERVEVREKASKVLGGLLHCSFLSKEASAALLARFTKESARKLRRRAREGEQVADFQAKQAAAVLERHAGVLGLASFVLSCPYDIPATLPPVLMLLGDRLHDPVPIPATVKRVFQDFKRTHQDNWSEHKLAFTEDQLVQLTDLLVSPSYYA